MNLLFPITLLFFTLIQPVAAQDFEASRAAYDNKDYGTALKHLRPLAEMGYPPAQRQLGWMYWQGQGVPVDYAEAVKWLRKASEQGNLKAQSDLVRLEKELRSKGKWPPSPLVTDKKTPKGTTIKTPKGNYQKGIIAYQSGDYATALSKWEPLAKQGHALAQNNLGFMYYNGHGVPQNNETAVLWYKLAAEQGYAPAQNNLGVLYQLGRGVPQSYKTAMKWYKLAADQRHVRAQSNLERLQKGVASEKPSPTVTAKKTSKIKSKPTPGFIPNYKVGIAAHRRGDWATALKHFRPLAEQGNTIAQHSIGVMHEHGRGVFQDYASAIKWYRKAAEQGNVSSQYNLGYMYKHGKGVLKDDTEAVKWWRKAARQGLAEGQYNLGVSYVDGRGVGYGTGLWLDQSLAYVWFSVAAANGYEKAAPARDEVGERLSQAELNKARVISKRCWKKPVNCPE